VLDPPAGGSRANPHFVDPAVVAEGHYTAPLSPGFSAEMFPESIAMYTYPDGAFWLADRSAGGLDA